MIEVPTPTGPARIHPAPVDDARAVLLLGHSAGGGVDDRALLAARAGAAAARVSTVLVELPYRVAGSKRPSPPAEADTAWLAVVAHLRSHVGDLVLVSGGRSYGGRVACRTASAAGAVGVLCLAFPLVPPYGAAPPSRLPELDAVPCPRWWSRATATPTVSRRTHPAARSSYSAATTRCAPRSPT